MPPLADPERRAHYQTALSFWNVSGYVNWTPRASEWVLRNFQGLTMREIVRLMHEYVTTGGEIDEVRERREEWSEHDFHYDLRFVIEGRRVYVETRLEVGPEPDDSTITVVNIHDA
jgi:hypothetical protein